MNDIWLPIILAIIAAIPGLFGLWRQLRKDSVDAAAQYAQMLSDEIMKRRTAEQSCDDIQDLLNDCKDRIERKEKYIRRLRAQLELHGIDPVSEDGINRATTYKK